MVVGQFEILNKDNPMQKLIDEFNRFFEGSAKINTVESGWLVTIGGKAMLVLPPSVGGIQGAPKDSCSVPLDTRTQK